MGKIHMHDEASAKAWLADVEALNDETKETVKEAGKAVKAIKEMADGSLIDELVIGGEKLMKAAEVLSGTMNEFTKLVNGIIGKAKEVLNEALKGVTDTFSAIK